MPLAAWLNPPLPVAAKLERGVYCHYRWRYRPRRWREEGVANGNGDTHPAGAAITTGGIVHVGLAHKAGETA